MKNRKLRIGILFGGKSGEHEVSFSSASAIIKALNREKYEVIPIGITREGAWLSFEESLQALSTGRIEGKNLIAWSSMPDKQSMLVMDKRKNELKFSTAGQLDVIFPALHGPNGEDGKIQGLLELIGIPYVGAGVAASAIAMDKDLMKKVFQQAGLPQTKWIVVKRKRWEREPEKVVLKIEKEISYPLFVKPTNLGSSVGITKAHHHKELTKAINLATCYDRKIIIESGLQNVIEIECGIIGNEELEISVVGEVKPAGEYYDYNAKYLDQKTEIIIPARLPHSLIQQIKKIAKKAYQSIDAAGLARVDFFVQKKGEQFQVYLNEINTMPGFTRTSMFPRLWSKTGLDFSNLVDRLIELALENFKENSQNKTTFYSALINDYQKKC